MLGGLRIPQSGERDFAASGGGFGRIDSEAVESAPLLRLDVREQSIRLGQFARFDGFLRIGFQGSDLGTVARLCRRRCLEVLEALGDFDELGSQPLWGNVILAKNAQRGADLALIEVEFAF